MFRLTLRRGRCAFRLGLRGDILDALDRFANGLRLVFELMSFLDPRRGNALVALIVRLSGEPLEQRDPFLEGPQSTPKRAPHAFVERDAHHFGGVGVTKVATETDEI